MTFSLQNYRIVVVALTMVASAAAFGWQQLSDRGESRLERTEGAGRGVGLAPRVGKVSPGGPVIEAIPAGAPHRLEIPFRLGWGIARA